jgi:hypothetical protein
VRDKPRSRLVRGFFFRRGEAHVAGRQVSPASGRQVDDGDDRPCLVGQKQGLTGEHSLINVILCREAMNAQTEAEIENINCPFC